MGLKKFPTLLLLLAYCFYAGLFIYRTSFVLDGQRYFSLFDDGMISMRYAKNLAAGQGLVWNPGGEKVEGYTNPLWVLYMAAVHLLPIPLSKISLVIQITSALCLLLNLLVIKKIAETVSNGSSLATLAALLLTAFYLPLNNWALQGMEVGLLALLISLSTWLALRNLAANTVPTGMYLLLGIGTLIRPDVVVPYLTIWLFLLIAQPQHRGQQALIGLSTVALFVIGQTAFRWFYHGDLLPNTYYLKMTGYPALLRIARGLLVLVDFIFKMNVAVFLLPLGVLLAWRDRRIALLLTVFAAQCAYSIYVGGDAWEWFGGSNRYISIAMPLLFVVFGCGLDYLRTVWENHLRHQGLDVLSTKVQRRIKAAIIAMIVISLISINAVRGPRAWPQWFLMTTPADTNRNSVELGQLVNRITNKDASVAVVWAGATPYFMDRYAIDLLGKNDRTIAHESMHLPPAEASLFDKLEFFYPGHLKYDYNYSLKQLKPDVVAQLHLQKEEAESLLAADYQPVVLSGHKLFLRSNSTHILWDEVAKLVPVK